MCVRLCICSSLSLSFSLMCVCALEYALRNLILALMWILWFCYSYIKPLSKVVFVGKFMQTEDIRCCRCETKHFRPVYWRWSIGWVKKRFYGTSFELNSFYGKFYILVAKMIFVVGKNASCFRKKSVNMRTIILSIVSWKYHIIPMSRNNAIVAEIH